MASTMTKTVVLDGKAHYVLRVDIDGDTTSEITATSAGNPIVDVSELGGTPTDVKIVRVDGNVGAFEIKLMWDANTDVQALALSQGPAVLDFNRTGGIINPMTASGSTGDVRLITEGLTAGENATLQIEFRKRGVV